MPFDRVAGRSVATTRWACGGEPEGVTPPMANTSLFIKLPKRQWRLPQLLLLSGFGVKEKQAFLRVNWHCGIEIYVFLSGFKFWNVIIIMGWMNRWIHRRIDGVSTLISVYGKIFLHLFR